MEEIKTQLLKKNYNYFIVGLVIKLHFESTKGIGYKKIQEIIYTDFAILLDSV